MVAEFSTLGSCASRIIFNSSVNTNYKDFFHINDSLEVVSIISLMSKPIPYDKSLLNSFDKFDNECVANDLDKSFLEFLKKNTIEYLLFDTYFDVECDVIVYDEDSYLSDSGRLVRTDYHRTLANKRRISIFNNFEEYMELWKAACDKFFGFLKENCPNIKVILNSSRGALYYLDENNEKVRFPNATYIHESNKLRDILELYILENFDVDILPFDDTTVALKNHFAHLHTVHYEDRFYFEKTDELNSIIHRNNTWNYNDDVNVQYRKIQRENLMLKFKLKNDWLNMEYREGNICDKLTKYNTGRIDLKNSGLKSNTVEVIEISDPDYFYYYPSWFDNIQGEGKGLVIESKKNFLDLTVKCIGTGELYLTLRGVDFRVNNERIPIYINYTKFKVNGIDILKENKLICHDKSYTIKLPVKNNDYVRISMSWTPADD